MRRTAPFVVDVQSDLLDGLASRVVVPLVLADRAGKVITRLNPVFSIKGNRVVFLAPDLSAVSERTLGSKVGSLAAHRQEILDSLDFLLTGI
jgi:toxin CcdB